MYLCYIADVNSVHLHRWAAFFIERGHQVSVITDLAGTLPGAAVHHIGDCLPAIRLPVFAAVYQIGAKALAIRRLLRQIKPDLVHGHYATNYGFLAALSGFTPLVQTVHGSDVLVDAAGSWEQRWFVRYALRTATLITSVADHMTRRLVAMHIPANREWITDESNGFLVPVGRPDLLGDRLAQALMDPALRAEAIGRNAALIRARGDYRTNMTMMESTYQRLIRR